MDQVCRSSARDIFEVEVKPETRAAHCGEYGLGSGHAIGRKEPAPFGNCVITYSSLVAFDPDCRVVMGDEVAIHRSPQVNLDEVRTEVSDPAKILRPVVLHASSAATMRDSEDVLCRAVSGRPERRQGRNHRRHMLTSSLKCNL